VLGRGGTIVDKAMWTSAAHIGEFLERQEARPPGPASSTFYVEQAAPVAPDRKAFQRGPRAQRAAREHRVRSSGSDLG
jgi:hypothetical protein